MLAVVSMLHHSDYTSSRKSADDHLDTRYTSSQCQRRQGHSTSESGDDLVRNRLRPFNLVNDHLALRALNEIVHIVDL